MKRNISMLSRALLVILMAGGLVYSQKENEAFKKEREAELFVAPVEEDISMDAKSEKQKLWGKLSGEQEIADELPGKQERADELPGKKELADELADELPGKKELADEMPGKKEMPDGLPKEQEIAEEIESMFDNQSEIVSLSYDAAADMTEGFFRSQLGEKDRDDYDAILLSCMTREKCSLNTTDEAVLGELFQFVLYDHPELFFLNGYTCTMQKVNGKISRLDFAAKYTMSEQQVLANQAGIDAYVENCFRDMPAGLDEYEITKYIYCYVISHTDYVKGCENNQNICSVFLHNESVCLGYAKAIQYLLQKQGIYATIVCGKLKGDLHGWNLVFVDGKWYHLDATWGDASYTDKGNASKADRIIKEENYDCFLVTTETIMKTHEILHAFYYPQANSNEQNYFQREGRYLTLYDEQKLKTIVQSTLDAGKKVVSVRAANAAVYADLKEELFENQRIFALYDQSFSTVQYRENEESLILSFWVP